MPYLTRRSLQWWAPVPVALRDGAGAVSLPGPRRHTGGRAGGAEIIPIATLRARRAAGRPLSAVRPPVGYSGPFDPVPPIVA